MSEEVYCALCGVPFGVDADLYRTGSVTEHDVVWTQYYTALRKDKYEKPCDWYLSGIGRNDSSFGWDSLVPTEPDYDARKMEDWPIITLVGSHACWYPKYPTSTEWCSGEVREVLYPMHPPCWEILQQSHARLATRAPFLPNLSKLAEVFAAQDLEEGYRGLIPSWAGDYNGPERFWKDGWSYHPEPDASEVVGVLEEAPEWNFLVHDPSDARGFAQLLDDPPLTSNYSNSSTIISWKRDNQDPFSRLPTELLMEVFCLLPTSSGQALRLVSRAMASISFSSSFWRSRFDFPNELCHIRLPQRLQTGPQVENMAVDWRELCYRLLHSADESWQNRKRIMTLNEKLVRMILTVEDDIKQAS